VTDPKTNTLDAPGAVLTYDVRSNDASTQPVLLIIGSPMGASVDRLPPRHAGRVGEDRPPLRNRALLQVQRPARTMPAAR
jgi:hypothetical protein